MNLVPIILSGMLAKQFGKRFELAVSSPREAVRALCSQIPGFEKAILEHPYGFRVWADKEPLPDSASLDRCTGARAIRIVPVVAGAKSGGQMILTGALLVAAVYFAPVMMGSGAAGSAFFGSGVATSIGVSLVLGGISQMLFTPPKSTTTNNQSNLLFSGSINTTVQGNSVPICYGKMLVGSQVIAAGIESVQIINTGVSTPPVLT